MSVTVTLHVFSGLPDPSWELTDAQAAELAERIGRATTSTLQKPPGLAGLLGYRGFSIQASREKTLPPHVYIHEGIVDLERFDVNVQLDSTEVEQWLLETAGEAVDGEVAEYVRGAIGGNGSAVAKAAPLLPPPFDPGKWNNDPVIRRMNNCYNYANDKITSTFAQPGRGSGQIFGALACPDVGAAAQRDGQRPVPSPAGGAGAGHFIALVIWPARDYHWYRLDSNGRWSHKPGQTAARDTDNSGRPISNPQTCDRGPYTSWCGYFHCVPSQTRIR